MFPLPFLGVGAWATSCLASCACAGCSCITREALKSSARVAYSLLFTFSLLFSWVLRDFAKPLLQHFPWIVKHFDEDLPADAWFGQQAVYRLSLGNFLMFGILAAALWGVKYKNEQRAVILHSGSWMTKVLLWLVFNTLPFFLPVGLIEAYSWVARFGSPLFLLMQMIILLDMTQNWNDAWVASGDEDPRFLYALLGVTLGAYSLAITILGLMYHWFAPSGHDCSLNITLITLALILCIVVSLLVLHPTVEHGSLFPASAISLYLAYLTYSALQSEPRDYECNGLGQRMSAASTSTQALGMGLTLISVVYSAFRAGSNTQTFSTSPDWDAEASRPLMGGGGSGGDEELTSAGVDGAAGPAVPGAQAMERGGSTAAPGAALAEFEPPTYSYAQFHGIFALASLYVAMLMTGWGSEAGEPQYLINVGWTSVWVKVVCQWATAALFAWSMVAPTLFPDRFS